MNEEKNQSSKLIKVIGITILLFLIVIPISFLFFHKENFLDPDIITSFTTAKTLTPTPTIIPKIDEYTYYFVPVTGFKELRNNVTFDELKNTNILVMASEENKISNAFPDFKLTPVQDSNFIEQIANGSDLAIVSWDKLDPRLKSLSIDNKFLFDKSINLTDYPLKLILKGTSEDLAKLTPFETSKINRILSTGEIIPARTVDKFMRVKNDYRYPFESVKPFMDKYDAQVSTFESPLLGSGNGNNCALNCMTFVGNEKFLDGMKYSGVDLVSLADNHSMNAGIDGIGNTIKLLNDANIKTIGAATTNNEDATKPAILDLGGIRYGFIAYNDIPSVSDWATDTKGGTARIDDDSYHILEGRAAKDVQRAKDMGAQFVIAMLHWGAREYTNEPLQHQKDIAHNLIDSGVDLIVGDHPHWVGAVEFYKDKFIYYGIGNFIFDQDWSTETSQGSLLEMNFYDGKLLSLKIYPHHITQTQPRLVDENSKEYKQIFDRIWQYTGKI